MRPGVRDGRGWAVPDRSGGRLAGHVYEGIKERLLEGRYALGEALQVEALKNDFGVSKQPVMDALRRLSGDGLVEIIPQVGCRVVTYDEQEIADFFAMFGGFEGTVAAAAATRRTDEQLAELAHVSARIGELRMAPDPAVRSHDYRILNRQYHAVIHAMAHSRIMAETTRRMWDLSDFLINAASARPPENALDGRHEDHERIRTALERRDPAAARREMEAHIVGTIGIIDAGA
ncbi:MAG TPA: GntR family transcriptional regulator [Streptosporangiaceae bacterium]